MQAAPGWKEVREGWPPPSKRVGATSPESGLDGPAPARTKISNPSWCGLRIGRSYTLRSVALTEEEIAKFYSGFANEIIWPLFHDMPSRCNFDPEYWEIYQRVNRKFAKVAAETAQDDDFVWVHDYHLMLTALR